MFAAGRPFLPSLTLVSQAKLSTETQCYKIIYSHNLLTSVFVSGKPFQASGMFVNKARAYPSAAPKRSSLSRVDSWLYPQTLDEGRKVCEGLTL